MLVPRFVARMLWLSLMIVNASVVSGQDYPNKPIHIFTSSVGGGSDTTSRIIAQGISRPLGQPVVVENRGGGGTISAGIVAKAAPDGYSLLINSVAFYMAVLLGQKMPYDPLKDFSAITITTGQPQILVVHPSLPVKSVKELIALAKARPGELNYASSGTGAGAHLTTELFKSMAGINMVHIPYKGSAPSVTALLGGEAQIAFNDVTPLAAHIKSGKLRALAITSAQPSPLFPGVPAVAATLPGFESVSMTGVFAPAKTPAEIINRLNQEIVRFIKTPEMREKFLSTGSEVVGSSAEELAAWVRTDMARWGKVIKDVGKIE